MDIFEGGRRRSLKSQVSLYHFVKRVFDIFFSLVFLLILSPLFVIISLFVCIGSRGAPFFLHYRVGKDGKIIYIYKFRTMVPHAEEMIASFTPEQKAEWEQNFKLRNDPRITRVGKILRATSLDELPQLFNILKGDMSFVGPRPVIESELEWYGKDRDRFLSATPGLTGWWACHGRSTVGYPERCALELYYVDNASVGLDLRIILRTLTSVFKRSGAM